MYDLKSDSGFANKRYKHAHIPHGMYEAVLKRPFDIVFSVLGLVLLSPILAAVGLLVRMRLGKPVIFVQERAGRINPADGREKIFKLYKFRTMTDKRDADGNLLPDEQRLTKFGRWLRSTSLDELPELFNILKGDMSIVGPRPLLKEYLPYYTRKERRRHLVRPGLTGSAQINGRNFLSWEDIFYYDVSYVAHITLWGDFLIILKTINKVIHKEDIEDASITEYDADGKPHITISGEDYTLHRRMDEERKKPDVGFVL